MVNISNMWRMPVCCLIPAALVSSFIDISATWKQETEQEFRVLSCGFSEDPELQPYIWAVPVHVLGHCVLRLLIVLAIIFDSHLLHPHVLLPLKPVLGWHLFQHQHSPQDATSIYTENKGHLLHGLPHSGVIFPCFLISGHSALACHLHEIVVAIPVHPCTTRSSQTHTSVWLAGLLPGSLVYSVPSFTFVWWSTWPSVEILKFHISSVNWHILELACSSTFLNWTLIYFMTGVLGVFPLIRILFSYSPIALSIRKMSSSGGKQKAFPPVGLTSQLFLYFYGTGVRLFHFCSDSLPPESLSGTLWCTAWWPHVEPLHQPEEQGCEGNPPERLLNRTTSCLW